MGLLIFTLVANLYLLLSQWSLLTVIQVTFFCWYLHFDNFNILKTACARAVSSIQYGHYSIMEEFSTWMMNFVFPWWWFQIRKRLLYRPYTTFNSTILMWTVLDMKNKKYLLKFLPASPKAKAGLGVQSLRPSVRLSVRPSVRPSVPKSCHRNSSETTDPIIMKLGM